jgi:ANTAR domain-containing protein
MRLLAGLASLEPGAAPLEQICRGSVALLAVSGAAVILMSQKETGAAAVTSNAGALAVEDLQFTLGEGPCLRAYDSGMPILEAELLDASDARWPEFSRQAVAAGARAVFALPLQLGAIRLGVLVLYRTSPGMLSSEQLADGFELAAMATTLVLEEQAGAAPDELGAGLRGEWAHRAVVHQATGMVAAQLGIGQAEAVARLRAHAFGSDRSVYDVAFGVVERRIRFQE